MTRADKVFALLTVFLLAAGMVLAGWGPPKVRCAIAGFVASAEVERLCSAAYPDWGVEDD